jgi:hypothetical protein
MPRPQVLAQSPGLPGRRIRRVGMGMKVIQMRENQRRFGRTLGSRENKLQAQRRVHGVAPMILFTVHGVEGGDRWLYLS